MKSILKWFTLGLIAFLVGLVYTVPAHLATPYLPAQVRISGIDGTLWNGHVKNLDLEGFKLGELQWHIQPLYLLLGRIKVGTRFHQTGLQGRGDVILGQHTLGFEDLHVVGNVDVVNPYISAYGTVLDGKFEMDFSSLEITQKGLQQSQGKLVLRNTQIVSPAKLTLGEVQIELAQKGETAVASLGNTGDTLRLSGTASITPVWRYITNLRIAPTSSTPKEIRQTLTLLGRTDSRGAVTLNNNGTIPILGWLPFLQQNENDSKET